MPRASVHRQTPAACLGRILPSVSTKTIALPCPPPGGLSRRPCQGFATNDGEALLPPAVAGSVGVGQKCCDVCLGFLLSEFIGEPLGVCRFSGEGFLFVSLMRSLQSPCFSLGHVLPVGRLLVLLTRSRIGPVSPSRVVCPCFPSTLTALVETQVPRAAAHVPGKAVKVRDFL